MKKQRKHYTPEEKVAILNKMAILRQLIVPICMFQGENVRTLNEIALKIRLLYYLGS
jgi:hypothetical protein